MILTLQQIERKVREYSALIFAPEDFIPTFGYSKESGLPHIEIVENSYHLIVSENGKELIRENTSDPDELLYLIMKSISLSMACERVSELTKYQSYKVRLFQAHKSIISRIHLSYMDRVELNQEEVEG